MVRRESVRPPKLFLHICCGPCATVVIERLQNAYAITGFFYNPNIFPKEEYNQRLKGFEKLVNLWKISGEVGRYEHQRFLTLVKGLESELEGGRRCEVCYRMRLRATAERAKSFGYDFFASTLTVGPKKPAGIINRIGEELAREYGVQFVAGDWKKENGFKRSGELSRKLGLYRQNYCGCEFARDNKFQKNFLTDGIGVV